MAILKSTDEDISVNATTEEYLYHWYNKLNSREEKRFVSDLAHIIIEDFKVN